jgi:hypothetical protein
MTDNQHRCENSNHLYLQRVLIVNDEGVEVAGAFLRLDPCDHKWDGDQGTIELPATLFSMRYCPRCGEQIEFWKPPRLPKVKK